MPELRFLVLIEELKCSPATKAALVNSGITYACIDDFCTGNSNEIKIAALLNEIHKELGKIPLPNVDEMLARAFLATRAEMTEGEEKQFYNKYIKGMHLVIAANGDLSIELGE